MKDEIIERNAMITEKETKSANLLRIIAVLRQLRDKRTISASEYNRAKQYYIKLTGADIAIVD
ncbi:MAG: hypothetical protein PHV32_00670 [Eubacteriales bacterium]|nr:hypothetical protein [Eubacteriales bacterium]